MSRPLVLLCTDGSELSVEALAAGVALIGPDARFCVVTASDGPDPMLLTGTGTAGGVVTPEEFDRKTTAANESARSVVDATIRTLGLEGAESRVVGGGAGQAICQLASELSAAAIVIGSRGRGGIKRAVLGSVSDHVVRHAPCPVLVTRATGAAG
jgi:nucleotide-binding universal stress UspA family protein